jgi:copper transport protein
MRALTAPALAFAAALALLLCAGTSVRAHAVLLETVPADGEVLEAAPTTVELRFSEHVRVLPGGMRVLDPIGERVDLDDASAGVTPEWVQVSLRPESMDGTYLVSWGVTSADGHPVRGSFVFHVGAPSAEPPSLDRVEPSTPTWVDIFSALGRFAGYTAALAAAGILLFAVLVHDGNAFERRRLLWLVGVGAAVGATAAPLTFFAESLVLTQGNIIDALRFEQLRFVARSGQGTAAFLLGATSLFLLAGTLPRARAPLGWLLPVAVLMTASFAWKGHSAATNPGWLGLVGSFGHSVAAAAWFGGLLSLALVARWRPGPHGPGKGGDAMMVRFSRLAMGAFILALLAGAVLAFEILPSPQALFDTSYGRVLLAKLLLVAIALVFAARHRRIVASRASDGGNAGLAGSRSTLAIQTLLLGGVIFLTGILAGRDPSADASPPSPPEPYHLDGFVGDFHFDLWVDPARPGTNTIAIAFHVIGDAAPETIQAVRVLLVEPELGIGPFERELELVEVGAYRYRGPEMRIAGEWQLTLAVRLSDFHEQRLTFSIPIR